MSKTDVLSYSSSSSPGLCRLFILFVAARARALASVAARAPALASVAARARALASAASSSSSSPQGLAPLPPSPQGLPPLPPSPQGLAPLPLPPLHPLRRRKGSRPGLCLFRLCFLNTNAKNTIGKISGNTLYSLNLCRVTLLMLCRCVSHVCCFCFPALAPLHVGRASIPPSERLTLTS